MKSWVVFSTVLFGVLSVRAQCPFEDQINAYPLHDPSHDPSHDPFYREVNFHFFVPHREGIDYPANPLPTTPQDEVLPGGVLLHTAGRGALREIMKRGLNKGQIWEINPSKARRVFVKPVSFQYTVDTVDALKMSKQEGTITTYKVVLVRSKFRKDNFTNPEKDLSSDYTALILKRSGEVSVADVEEAVQKMLGMPLLAAGWNDTDTDFYIEFKGLAGDLADPKAKAPIPKITPGSPPPNWPQTTNFS